VPALRFDAEQRFDCRSCTRCCRGWDVPVAAAESQALRARGAQRYFREREDGPEGAVRDFLLPAPGGLSRLRRRGDGTCGFLSPSGRCRLHEALGVGAKPLACRAFPFRIVARPAETLVAASLSCPTVVRSEGTRLGERARELAALEREWQRTYPEPAPARGVWLVAGRRLPQAGLEVLREGLRAILDRRGPDGGLELSTNLNRAAAWLQDVMRWRVRRLADERLVEYLSLTWRYHATSDRLAPPPRAGRLSRLLFRGLLVAVAATREQRAATPSGWRGRARLVALTLHLHGLGPAVAGFDRRRGRAVHLDRDEPRLAALLHHAARAPLATLGTSGLPVVEEAGLAFAAVSAGCVLAAQHAAAAGREAVTPDDLVTGLAEAADVRHAAGTLFERFLGTLAGGAAAAALLAAGPPLVSFAAPPTNAPQAPGADR